MSNTRLPVLKIPVEQYLAKFFYWRLQVPQDTVIDLNERHSILRMIQVLLKGKQPYYIKNSEASIDHYDGEIRVRLTKTYYQDGWYTFPEKSSVHLNGYLRYCLHEIILDQVNLNPDAPIKEVIYNFMVEADIVDDISYEAIKKANYRHRKRIENLNEALS